MAGVVSVVVVAALALFLYQYHLDGEKSALQDQVKDLDTQIARAGGPNAVGKARGLQADIRVMTQRDASMKAEIQTLQGKH